MEEAYYRPLKLDTEFRLVTILPGAEDTPIHAKLVHCDLRDKNRYEALSYECGGSTPDDPYVYVNDVPIKIYRNLFNFLGRLRAASDKPRSLFIDAVSINQNDFQEKAQQIELMGEIYRGAKTVIGWLGEHSSGSDIVFKTSLVDRMNSVHPVLQVLNPVWMPANFVRSTGRALKNALSDSTRPDAWRALLERPYFNRTWIVQEILLSRSITFFCGSEQMDGDLVFQKPFVQHFQYKMMRNRNADGVPRTFLLYFAKMNQKRHRFTGDGKSYFNDLDIFELAYQFQHTECRDPMDRVYALLSLEAPSQGQPIKPNYHITPCTLFLSICMLRLPNFSKFKLEASDKSVARVAMLFQGLKLNHSDAEAILDALLDGSADELVSSEARDQVAARIITAFDLYGLLKPERSELIVPYKTKLGEIKHITREWREKQRKVGRWHSTAWLPSVQSSLIASNTPGMVFAQLPEPLWTRGKALGQQQSGRNAAMQANTNQQIMNQQMMNNQLMINQMNSITMASIMNPAGGMLGGGGA